MQQRNIVYLFRTSSFVHLSPAPCVPYINFEISKCVLASSARKEAVDHEGDVHEHVQRQHGAAQDLGGRRHGTQDYQEARDPCAYACGGGGQEGQILSNKMGIKLLVVRIF